MNFKFKFITGFKSYGYSSCIIEENERIMFLFETNDLNNHAS